MKNKPVAIKIVSNHQIRVRFSETDALGIVWHGNYIKYFEEGREAFGREHGITYLAIKSNGYATPIVKSVCEHKLPVTYGEVIHIETTYIDSLAAKMFFQYKITNSQGNIVCIGETTQVFVNDSGELSLNIPFFFEKWKSKYVK